MVVNSQRFAAWKTAGGSVQTTGQKTPELTAWIHRLEPALEEIGVFLQDENSSWWKSDKEFAMQMMPLDYRSFDDLSDELKNDKDILLSFATAKAANGVGLWWWEL